MLSAATIARVMGGRVYQGAALVPGPNHQPAANGPTVMNEPRSVPSSYSVQRMTQAIRLFHD
jgi:hypothetical protein